MKEEVKLGGRAPPWFELCPQCGAPLRDITHAIEHVSAHYPKLWAAIRNVGKKPK